MGGWTRDKNRDFMKPSQPRRRAHHPRDTHTSAARASARPLKAEQSGDTASEQRAVNRISRNREGIVLKVCCWNGLLSSRICEGLV